MPNGPDKPQLPTVAAKHRAHAWARRRKNGMQESLTNKRLGSREKKNKATDGGLQGDYG